MMGWDDRFEAGYRMALLLLAYVRASKLELGRTAALELLEQVAERMGRSEGTQTLRGAGDHPADALLASEALARCLRRLGVGVRIDAATPSRVAGWVLRPCPFHEAARTLKMEDPCAHLCPAFGRALVKAVNPRLEFGHAILEDDQGACRAAITEQDSPSKG